jgi:Yip1 domain
LCVGQDGFFNYPLTKLPSYQILGCLRPKELLVKRRRPQVGGFMSASVPPVPSEVATAALSEAQRIGNVFTSPSKTFQDLRRSASWWVPFLLLAIFSFGVGALLAQKLNWEPYIRDEVTNSPRAQAFESLPREQQDRQIAIGVKIARVSSYLTPVFILIGGLIVAALLMATFNFGFEAEIPYGRSLAIVFYSWLPFIFHGLLAISILIIGTNLEDANPKNLVATNLGYFMDRHTTSKLLYGLASSVDVLGIWAMVLLGIGFKVNSANRKLSTGTAVATVVILLVLLKAVASGLGFA